ncbi:hypothetical protein [Micrococcus luteus]|uniref:hypothetical protein n=1 Tax=Micrococcus luteus TaxID=1270 RepID=UPI0011AB8A8D|nr:hypothetical protein [Micrococcus luteus]
MTAKPSDPHVGLVVEGAGDLGAVPIVLRNYLYSVNVYADILGKPVPFHGRDKAIAVNGIEGYVATAAYRPGCRGVMVVLDGEGDCVVERGAELLQRAGGNVSIPIVVALADSCFESWMYASAETLEIGLDYDENKSGLGAIKNAIRPNSYTKPVWQPRLASKVDIALARGRDSGFNRFLERFDALAQLALRGDL